MAAIKEAETSAKTVRPVGGAGDRGMGSNFCASRVLAAGSLYRFRDF